MHDRRVVRMERLNDHPAFIGIPPRPTGDLDEQAEGPLLRPEIGNVHPAVRQNDADQFDVGKFNPLATICVPRRMSVSPFLKRSSTA